MTECEVCYANATELICFRCNYALCFECVGRYLLESENLPHCMNCRVMWDQDDMVTRLGFAPKWIKKTLKDHCISILVARADANIPETQAMLRWIEQRDVEVTKLRGQIKELGLEIVVLQYKLNTVEVGRDPELKQQVGQELGDLRLKSARLRDVMDQLLLGDSALEVARNLVAKLVQQGIPQEEAEAIVRDTDINEVLERVKGNGGQKILRNRCRQGTCPGWLDASWWCSLCDNTTCRLCFELSKPNHTCKEEDVASAALITQSSKPCPTCGVMVFRISGCNHMYCTACKSGFNWDTLKVIKKIELHNPHAREGEHLCHNGLNVGNFEQTFGLLYPNSKAKADKLTDLFRRIMGFVDRIVPDNNPFTRPYQSVDNLNLKYVKNEYTRPQWMQALYQNHVVLESNQAFSFLYEIVRDNIIATLNAMFSTVVTAQSVADAFKILAALQIYANEQVVRLKAVYGRSQSSTFDFLPANIVAVYAPRDETTATKPYVVDQTLSP